MDKNLANIANLVEELNGETREGIDADKLEKLVVTFGEAISESEKPHLNKVDELPGWFIIHAVVLSWFTVKDKSYLLNIINAKLESSNHRDLKIELAAKLSVIDPLSGLILLAAVGNKPPRKDGVLPKSYFDLLAKHFIGEDAKPIQSILEYRFNNHPCLECASLQLFEVIFECRTTLKTKDKHEIQANFIKWMISHGTYEKCTKTHQDVLTNCISKWPISMLNMLQSIQSEAQDIKIHSVIGNYNQMEVSSDVSTENNIIAKQQVQGNFTADELLDRLKDMISDNNNQLSIKSSQLTTLTNEISIIKAKILTLENHNASIDNKNNKLRDEVRSLNVAIHRIKDTNASEVNKLENDKNLATERFESKCKENIELIAVINSSNAEHINKIDDLTKRIRIETEHATNELKEIIQAELAHDFSDMKQLGDSDRHRTAKIMLENIFKKLNRIGIVFN